LCHLAEVVAMRDEADVDPFRALVDDVRRLVPKDIALQRLAQTFGWDDFPQPLFYQCPFALRFELGGNHEMGPTRFLQAMDRARSVASMIFAETENLTVAVPFVGRRANTPVPARLRRALKSTGFSGKIGAGKRMEPRDEDDEMTDVACGYHRFLCALDTHNSPDQIAPFIWAAIANEMPIAPHFACMSQNYIMDLGRGIVLHAYDDRGMDLIAISAELLRPCYEQFNEWLLDCDRVQMDTKFSPAAIE
jgi:hypothetical protein